MPTPTSGRAVPRKLPAGGNELSERDRWTRVPLGTSLQQPTRPGRRRDRGGGRPRGSAAYGLRVTVFNGPVFADDDPKYRNIRLPQRFWKIAVLVDEDTDRLSATGYLLTQVDEVADTTDEFVSRAPPQVPALRAEVASSDMRPTSCSRGETSNAPRLHPHGSGPLSRADGSRHRATAVYEPSASFARSIVTSPGCRATSSTPITDPWVDRAIATRRCTSGISVTTIWHSFTPGTTSTVPSPRLLSSHERPSHLSRPLGLRPKMRSAPSKSAEYRLLSTEPTT
ncbi:MAG: DNA/RNA non-specific endonuclease [Deltaproteobacteria bacterium]|nr:DNA/RNA non-specific endonuclease [Deltaproteobacteria bacterium]